jgi:hypothetical protein
MNALSNGELVRSIGPELLKLLKAWMGVGPNGARKAMGSSPPQGLMAQSLRTYQEIARRQIAAGLDTAGTQAARIQLIEEGLRRIGE